MVVQKIAPAIPRVIVGVLRILLHFGMIDLLYDVDTIRLIREAEVPLEQGCHRAAHRVHTDVFGVEIVRERGKRGSLLKRAVREQIALERAEQIGNLRDQLIGFELLEHCNQDPLLTVDAVYIALLIGSKPVARLTDATVVQKRLPVDMLHAFLIGPPLDFEADVHVVFQSAAEIDEIL